MFVCAYLMRLNDWPLEKVFLHFKSKSRSFSPNVAILARLGEYETSLSGTKYLEESIKEGEEGRPQMARKEKDRLSEELKYVRRQQAHHLEDERALEAQDDGEEEEDPRQPSSGSFTVPKMKSEAGIVPKDDALPAWLRKTQNIPFYTIKIMELTGEMIMMNKVQGADYTGNEARPDSIDSIYMSYAMVLLPASG